MTRKLYDQAMKVGISSIIILVANVSNRKFLLYGFKKRSRVCVHLDYPMSDDFSGHPSNKESNKPLYQDWGYVLIPFIMIVPNHVDIAPSFKFKRALMTLKHFYKVKKSSYLYSVRNSLLSTWLGMDRYKWYWKVLEPIPDPDVGVCLALIWEVYLFCPHKRCLSVWPHNPVGHNEEIVFT